MAFPFFLLAIVGAGAAIAFSSDHHDAPTPTPGGYGGTDAPPLPALTCDQALSNLPPALADKVPLAVAFGNDPAALDNLALTLEAGAGMPGLSTVQRAAVIKAAQCARDRAAALRLSQMSTGGAGLAPPPVYSAASTASLQQSRPLDSSPAPFAQFGRT